VKSSTDARNKKRSGQGSKAFLVGYTPTSVNQPHLNLQKPAKDFRKYINLPQKRKAALSDVKVEELRIFLNRK